MSRVDEGMSGTRLLQLTGKVIRQLSVLVKYR
jgi:hypothetical protein